MSASQFSFTPDQLRQIAKDALDHAERRAKTLVHRLTIND